MEMTEVNGEPAVLIGVSGLVFSVLTIEGGVGQLRTVHLSANLEKLAGVQAPGRR